MDDGRRPGHGADQKIAVRPEPAIRSAPRLDPYDEDHHDCVLDGQDDPEVADATGGETAARRAVEVLHVAVRSPPAGRGRRLGADPVAGSPLRYIFGARRRGSI